MSPVTSASNVGYFLPDIDKLSQLSFLEVDL
jgi:hypothetical protein